jgi:hypothetical protein
VIENYLGFLFVFFRISFHASPSNMEKICLDNKYESSLQFLFCSLEKVNQSVA